MTTDMHAERIATALERIADALERAHPKFNPGGYIEPTWLAMAPDPLDESDHRPRHDSYDQHLYWNGACWHTWKPWPNGRCSIDHTEASLQWWALAGPLTFCDCPDDPTDSDRATD
jgi:hypothetical protein